MNSFTFFLGYKYIFFFFIVQTFSIFSWKSCKSRTKIGWMKYFCTSSKPIFPSGHMSLLERINEFCRFLNTRKSCTDWQKQTCLKVMTLTCKPEHFSREDKVCESETTIRQQKLELWLVAVPHTHWSQAGFNPSLLSPFTAPDFGFFFSPKTKRFSKQQVSVWRKIVFFIDLNDCFYFFTSCSL